MNDPFNLAMSSIDVEKANSDIFTNGKKWFGRHPGLFLIEANFRAGEDLNGFEGIW